MKQVIDPETPLSLFKIDAEAKKALPPRGTPPVLSPFDENALEAALKIKDMEEATITVVSMGKKLSKAVVRSSLAVGADQLVLLEDSAFEDLDSCQTAQVLASAIRKIGDFDMILCGIQAADTNAGQVGPGIARILGIPAVNIARHVTFIQGENRIEVERVQPDGYDIIAVDSPALVTVSYEVGNLREPGVEGFLAATTKPLTKWKAQDLGIDPVHYRKMETVKLCCPERDSQCEMVEGVDAGQKAEGLVKVLEAEKLIIRS
jgi:electron transfer flavoprotein beta subunit